MKNPFQTIVGGEVNSIPPLSAHCVYLAIIRTYTKYILISLMNTEIGNIHIGIRNAADEMKYELPA